MPAQTQESKRAGMNAFLDIYEEFDGLCRERWNVCDDFMDRKNRIAMFAIYVGRME